MQPTTRVALHLKGSPRAPSLSRKEGRKEARRYGREKSRRSAKPGIKTHRLRSDASCHAVNYAEIINMLSEAISDGNICESVWVF